MATDEGTNAALLTGLIVPNVHCPSDSKARLLDHERFNTCGGCDYGTGPAGTKSMGQSYAPSGGPLDMNGCAIPAWPDGRNCQSSSGGRMDKGAPGMFAAVAPRPIRLTDTVAMSKRSQKR